MTSALQNLRTDLPRLVCRLLALALGSLTFGADIAAAQATQGCPPPEPGSNLVMSFNSDFASASALDLAQWRPFAGQHGDVSGELQAFAPGQVSVVRSVGLRLQTDKREVWGHPFVSGEVTTQGLFSQLYGRFEILAKMPQANGLWPAFWLLPTDNSWPPEIDVLEYIFAPFGKTPNWFFNRASIPFSALHWVDARGNRRSVGSGYDSPIQPLRVFADWGSTPAPAGYGRDYVGYHRYGVDWRPGSVVWLIDGRPVFCVEDNPATGRRVPDKPMFMILSAAVTAGTSERPAWPGYVAADQKFPQSVDVAYARAWKFRDVRGPPAPLEIVNVSVSNSSVRAGDTLRVRLTLNVGDRDLAAARGSRITLNAFDISQYYGIGRPLASAALPMPRLRAHTRYTTSASYVVSSGLKPGAYAIVATIRFACRHSACVNSLDEIAVREAGVVTVLKGDGAR